MSEFETAVFLIVGAGVLFAAFQWLLSADEDRRVAANPVSGHLREVERALTTFGHEWRLKGDLTLATTLDGVQIEVTALEMNVKVRGAIHPEVLVGREGIGSGVRRLAEGPDLLTGDAAFDADVHVRGPRHELLALLDADARKEIRQAVADGSITVEHGAVTLTSTQNIRPDEFERGIRRAVTLARLLSEDGRPFQERLFATTKAETDPKALACQLSLFHRELAGLDAAMRAGVLHLGHVDAGVRLAAARLVRRKEGDETLASLARNGWVPEETRAEALQEIDERGGDVGGDLLSACLDPGKVQLARVALHIAQRRNVSLAAAQVVGLLGSPDTWTRMRVASLLDPADPEAKAALLRLLDDPEPRVIVAAIDSLRAADVGVVERLRALDGLLVDRTVKAAAREAIAALQARASGEAGALTLADGGDAGRMSIATQPGAVAIAGERKKTT